MTDSYKNPVKEREGKYAQSKMEMLRESAGSPAVAEMERNIENRRDLNRRKRQGLCVYASNMHAPYEI